MNRAVLSMTQFEQATILESFLKTAPTQPDPCVDVAADVVLDVETTPMVSVQDDVDSQWSKHLILHVEVTLHDSGESAFELMRARIVLSGGATSPDYAETSFEELDRHLSANVVSMLYGVARTYLELLTSMSPVQRLTLPAIDPYAVVDSQE